MKAESISFIVPVYNRPEEVDELLNSICELDGALSFEVVIVEDGSTLKAEDVVASYNDRLDISYYYKPNSGPGDSRNFGMDKAKGDYFIILDSDCLLPKHYLESVMTELNDGFVDCFGGPDKAHAGFTIIQKAINFAMTSWITTGGIRGKRSRLDKFQPRSFNMGLSKTAFQATGGFGKIHPGEDPDLSIRLLDLGFSTRLFPEAYVYHKRRISWSKFYQQVNKFGMVRAILNRWHPKTKRLFYWFPTLFIFGLLFALILWVLGFKILITLYGVFFSMVFIGAWSSNRNILVGLLAIVAVIVQFSGYGLGFLTSQIKLIFMTGSEEEIFPNLFFK
ncbi:MAG: glycosyltransferase [Flavobacteriaceae bacterium]|nr:glycosyltransferase [Flavobacteriaceae bacterium]